MSKRNQRIAKLVAAQDPEDRIVLPPPQKREPTPQGVEELCSTYGYPLVPHRVYLAGKISKNCWRHSIFKDLRQSSEDSPPNPVNNLEYAGPYFLSCDHGCYHGENSHGAGANMPADYECSEDPLGSPWHVARKCYFWLDKSDVVFAYLDGDKPYGSIFEIGIALGLQKQVYLAFGLNAAPTIAATRERLESLGVFMEDVWLASQFANGGQIFGSAQEAWRSFVGWYSGRA